MAKSYDKCPTHEFTASSEAAVEMHWPKVFMPLHLQRMNEDKSGKMERDMIRKMRRMTIDMIAGHYYGGQMSKEDKMRAYETVKRLRSLGL